MRIRSVQATLALMASGVALAALPPVPVPVENPISEPKRILGKILFWDEQLSSDGTIACGSCHRPDRGGVDARIGVNPGPDGVVSTPDDILGSPGVVLEDINGNPLGDEVFGTGVQVTGRASMSAVNSAYVPEAFWDGRAGTTFLDPETGEMSIAAGGALENQAIGPVLSNVEMAHDGRSWEDVRNKLNRCAPMEDATNIPADLQPTLAARPSYADLFETAFGDPDITGERIAQAIATYERTLIADQTPWDRFTEGDPGAMTPQQVRGWDFFRASPCATCHTPPLFTNNSFRNIGIRPPAEDLGRQEVTGLLQDRGRFKVPTLRNIGLKLSHMHNGRIANITAAVRWYRPNNPARSNDNLDPLLPVPVPAPVLPDLVEFLFNGLTDPRVAAATFPFDRPELHRGQTADLEFADKTTLTWPAIPGAQRFNLYRGDLSDLTTGANGAGDPENGYGDCLGQTSSTVYPDGDTPLVGEVFFYLKTVVDSSGQELGVGTNADGRTRGLTIRCDDVF